MVRITCTISFSTDNEPDGRSHQDGFDDHYKRVAWSRDGEHPKYQEEGEDVDEYDGPEDEEAPDISLTTFFGGCSLHGGNHVFVQDKLSIRRVMWTVVFLLAISLFLKQVVDRIIYYLQYDYITLLDERNAKNMIFPAITLCNFNTFRRSQLSYSDLLFMGPLLGYEDNMAPGIPLAPEPDRQGSRFSLPEFFNRTRHRMDDMLLECNFAGKECGPEHWREVGQSSG